jgi:CheY-like chemotaxis protein
MSSESIKFLLVDDLEENLLALEALLRREGLELLKAKSGQEALELLLVHDFALALLDVQMPGMDGFELAEQWISSSNPSPRMCCGARRKFSSSYADRGRRWPASVMSCD